jgi:glycosyltransferase involved in cell wall biosynthesis
MDARKFRSFEQRYMASFDGAVSCSQDDADFIQDLTPGLPVTVIGNGVDLEYFRPTPMPVSGPPKLLYLGSMNYEPNIDAVDHFFRRIHPHLVSLVPDVEVQVVGHGPPPAIRAWERLPGVTVTGAVSDVRPYIEACTALIVPLRFGGGTRLKILEAIAAGRPVVSTSIGAEGLGLGHGEHLLLADEPTAFARETARLVRDAALRRRLTEASRPVVAERFAWSALGASLEELCRVTVRRVTR